MFRKNERHWQMELISSIYSLPKKQQERLEASWAGTFYREYFCRMDETPFAVLYSDVDSRPNIPINVLVGLEALKAGFGWSDEEAYDHFCFDVQVRYALGYRDLNEGHFELRTLYNFRERVARRMQETGENLIARAFEQVADQQVAAYRLKTNKLRVDSTQIASNIRRMSRLQLLVEVLQRAHRMLEEADQERYTDAFAPYLKGSSGQYLYHIKGEEYAEHLQRAGELMQRLLAELPTRYVDEPAYQVLARVFAEHFAVEEANLRAKAGEELSASSLQSPDDWEATYRQKRGQGYVGYVANVTETCHPENPFQLIVKVQTEPNTTDDAAMLATALPELKARTGVDEMNADGGYNGAAADDALREQHVQLVQTAIRGRQPAEDRVGLDDFVWQMDADGRPQQVTCPQGQQAPVTSGRKAQRYRAAFDARGCARCAQRAQCPVAPLKGDTENVLRFAQQNVDVALRRQRCAEARANPHNLRAAIEATVRAVKCPFGNGKVPVRGQRRVSMVMIGSATMNNVRQINRYESSQRPAKDSFFAAFWARLCACLRSICPLRLAGCRSF
jgi:hypothetical protein